MNTPSARSDTSCKTGASTPSSLLTCVSSIFFSLVSCSTDSAIFSDFSVAWNTCLGGLQIQAAEESKQAAESFLSYKADIKFTLKLGDKRKTKDSTQKEHSINILE